MRLATTALAAALLAAGLHGAPANAADRPSNTQKSAAAVGIRTASPQGGDDRGVYDYEILPRGVVKDYVAVSNFRYKPITVALFAKDAATTTDSGFAIQPTAQQPTDVGAWTVLGKNKVTIPPRREIVIPFQVGVPYNATPGDHSGAIVLSLLATQPKPDGQSIIVEHRVAMRIHLRVPGAMNPQLSVEHVKVDWNGEGDALGRGDAVVTYTVRNTGNVRMSASGDVALIRALGLPKVSGEAPVVEDILPGGEATYTQTFEDVLGTGPMKAVVSLDPAPIDPALPDIDEVSSSVRLWAFPRALLAEILGLLLFLGLGGWAGRSRRRARRTPDTTEEEMKPEDDVKAEGVLVRLIALMGVLGAVVLGLPPSSAQAAQGDQWQAMFKQKSGTSADALDFDTSGGCPLPATNVVGYVYGEGFPQAGAIAVSNTEAGVSSEFPFSIPVLDSMNNMMATQPEPKAFHGVYKFVLRCITPEWPDKSYGEYVAAIRFSDPYHWKVLPPLTRKLGPIADYPTTGQNGEPSTGQPADRSTAKGDKDDDQAQDPDAASEQSSADQADAARVDGMLNGADDAGESDGSSWPFLPAGAAVLAAVGLFLFGSRLPRPWRRG